MDITAADYFLDFFVQKNFPINMGPILNGYSAMGFFLILINTLLWTAHTTHGVY